MKCLTTYRRLQPTTAAGEGLVITQTYTTFDSNEMNEFEKFIESTISNGVSVEFELDPEMLRQTK